MANTSQTWTVTPSQYAGLVAKAQAAGIPLTGAGQPGPIETHGVVLEETYDGTTLTITVESRAWYDPSVSDIQAKIAAAINGALAET